MGLVKISGGWVNSALLENFEMCTSGEVDGVTWYVIRSYNDDVAAWIRQQHAQHRYEHKGTHFRHGHLFEVDEHLYTLLCLRWSQ